MAKKRKGRSRKGRRKRSAPKSDRAMPGGAAGGMVLSGVKMMTTNNTLSSPLTKLKEKNYTGAIESLKNNLVDIGLYKEAAVGVGISAAPKLPLIKMVAKPVDKAVRRVSKGKVSL